MRDDPAVTALVTRAANGEEQAWDALVERYAPLIWSICREHRLAGADAGDVGQRVWPQLVDHLDQVRDPAALPGWLATTTRRECARVQRAARGTHTAAHPGPAAPVRHHQRHAEHPGRQHRAEPRPLPGQAPPRPGHRSTDQRRSRQRGK
jgi:DNA-directed RNA polymerase specialized sigma24 family protein